VKRSRTKALGWGLWAGGPGGDRRILGIVFLTVFLDLIGFGILIPIQPFYAEYFGARPAAVTLLSASFSLVQFLFAPLLGRISDRVGRRRIMLGTIAINATGYLLFGLARSLPMLFAARMTSGLGSANLGTAQAIIADVTTPETRARGMGVVGAAFGLGFILGPAVGGFFGQYGLAVPAFVAAGFSTFNLLLAVFILPETRRRSDEVRSEDRPRLGLSRQSLSEAVRHANVPQLMWIYLVGTLGFSLMEQVLGLFIEHTWVPRTGGAPPLDHLRQAAALTAWFMIVVGITLAVVQGLFIGRLARVLGERRLVQIGLTCIAAGLALVPIAGRTGVFPALVVVGVVIAIGGGLTNPALPSLLSQAVGSDAYGGTLGLGQSLSALGRIAGPSVAGVIFELHPAAPFWIGSLLYITCIAVAFRIRPGRPAAGTA
jgi:MFS family permease